MYTKLTLGSYEVLDTIGSGSFGAVYKARHKQTLQTYAIKVIDFGKLMANNVHVPFEYIEREVLILKKLSHPNIVGLTEYIVEDDKHILVMEYCGGPTLDVYRKDRANMNEEFVRKLFSQFAAGLKYMRSKSVVHRDLKPQNILFTSSTDDDAQLKIIDFGFSQIRDNMNMMTSMVGTPIYMAPEILQNKPYTGKSDLWSVGCILYEILTGFSPFAHATSQANLIQMHNYWPGPKLPPSAVHVSPMCMDLLSRLLTVNPLKRIDWHEFFKHPFISNPDTLAESNITVHIAPMCRSVTLNTRELESSSLVSAMKADLLSDSSPDAEKYDGVAAVLETKDGKKVEMLDHQPVSEYKDLLSNASVIYLVLPLNKNKEQAPDTAYEVLEAVLANKPASVDSGIQVDKNAKSLSNSNSENELTSLHDEFMELAEELRESGRCTRLLYETCAVYLECREIQVNALRASVFILENHINELHQLSISFKKMYKEPMEQAAKTLPEKVERFIAQLRSTPVDSTGLPTLKGKSLLDCVGEAEIRAALRGCIETVMESGRLVESCDASLEHSRVASKALECVQHELEYNKRDWHAMRDKLQIVDSSQDAVDAWVTKVDEHLIGAASWLGFSFEDPLREGLKRSRAYADTAREAAREVRRLAQAIGARSEMWPVLVGEFRTVSNARAQVFSAFSSLHVCGTQSYEPQRRVIEDLEHLPELAAKIVDTASQVTQARSAFEKRAFDTARTADESIMTMRTGVMDTIKNFHIKYEKHPFAKGFVDAVDLMVPPPLRITMSAQDPQARVQEAASTHAAFVSAQTQNAQLRAEAHDRANEIAALHAHIAQLSGQLTHAHHKEMENMGTIRMMQQQLTNAIFKR